MRTIELPNKEWLVLIQDPNKDYGNISCPFGIRMFNIFQADKITIYNTETNKYLNYKDKAKPNKIVRWRKAKSDFLHDYLEYIL